MSNLNNDVGRFFMCVLIVILVANSAVAFGKILILTILIYYFEIKGSIISAIAPNPTAGSAISAPLLVPLMIFSGFFLNNA